MAKKEVNENLLLNTAISAARAAGKFLVAKQKTAKVKVRKGKWDIALDADIQAEKLIKKIIKKKFPNHSFFAEESKLEKHKSDYEWVIDPLDGTINYAHKIPLFAVSIAVLLKKQPIVAVVNIPLLNEFFYAAKGKGAFLNNKRIYVNKENSIKNIFVAGNPANLCKFGKKINLNLARYLGCSAVEMAFVACGRFSARLKPTGVRDPFGTAAGSLLIREAGGVFTDLDYKNWNEKTSRYIASNKIIHKKLLSIFRK